MDKRADRKNSPKRMKSFATETGSFVTIMIRFLKLVFEALGCVKKNSDSNVTLVLDNKNSAECTELNDPAIESTNETENHINKN